MRNKRLLIIFSVLCALTCIILLSSVVFSVQKVYEICINGDSTSIIEGDITLGEKVLDSHGIKKGRSIFLADLQSAEQNIESKIPIVNVTSISREFPNRIYIKYEILFDFFQVKTSEGYYVLSDECKITAIQNVPRDSDKIVDVLLLGETSKQSAGEILDSSGSGEVEVLSSILVSLKRLGLEYFEITQLLDFIDLRSNYEFIFLKTSTGVYIRLMGWDDIALKLQAAFSVYARDPVYRNVGTITVSDSLIPTYSKSVYYSP